MADSATTRQDAGDIAAAAARACATDPAIQALLQRKATGQKLTPQEYGRLGQWKAAQNRAANPVPAAKPNGGEVPRTVVPTAGPENGAAVQPEVPADAVPLSPGDASFASRTVGALVTKANNIGKRHLVGTAREIVALAEESGLRPPAIDSFTDAVVFSEDDRNILMETTPAVCEALNINPRSIPVGTFFGTLGMGVIDFVGAVGELKKLKQSIADERKKLQAAKADATAQS